MNDLKDEKIDVFYIKLVESVNTIKRLDYRLEALIEVGNIAADIEELEAFNNARKYVCEMIKKLQPDFALKRMIKYICKDIVILKIIDISQIIQNVLNIMEKLLLLLMLQVV